jgi:predicted transcriptional regulator
MQTSNDNLEEIIANLRRFHDKNNEISKKKFSLANEVDLLQQRIDKDRESLVETMARVGRANEEMNLEMELKEK